KVHNQVVVGLGLPDSQPGKERDQEQHRDDRDVVRRGNNLPDLVPILHRVCEQSEQRDNYSQADPSVPARTCLRMLLDDCAHFFFNTFISDSSMTGAGPEIPPSLRMRQKCTAIKIEATSGMPIQCQM